MKINLAVDRLPVFASHPAFDPQVHGGTIVLAESLDDLEAAFQDAVAGQPSRLPFADICIPSVFDDSLAPAGQHVISMFTQWVPHTYAQQTDEAALTAYADRVIARLETLRQASPARCCTGRSSAPARCRNSMAWSAATSSTAS